MFQWNEFMFQKASSNIMMEEMLLFHDFSLSILCYILGFVGSMILFSMSNMLIDKLSLQPQMIENIWIIFLVSILFFLTIPSLSFLYTTNDSSFTDSTIKNLWSQENWHYETSEFNIYSPNYEFKSSLNLSISSLEMISTTHSHELYDLILLSDNSSDPGYQSLTEHPSSEGGNVLSGGSSPGSNWDDSDESGFSFSGLDTSASSVEEEAAIIFSHPIVAANGLSPAIIHEGVIYLPSPNRIVEILLGIKQEDLNGLVFGSNTINFSMPYQFIPWGNNMLVTQPPLNP